MTPHRPFRMAPQGVQPIANDAYRALFEANPQPMWVFEKATLRFLAVNDAAVRQYGYSREEFLRLTILDIRPEEDAVLFPGHVQSRLSEPRVWTHRRKDGSTLLAEITAHDIVFMGSEARLVLALDVSLSERNAHRVEQTNRVLQSAPVGVLVVAPDGRVVESNPEARRLLGTEGPLPLNDLIEAALRGEAPTGAEIDLGNGVWVEAAASRVETRTGGGGAVVALVEATARRDRLDGLAKRIEDLSTLLREREAELDRRCHGLSHDLRSPLRAIEGFTGLVLSDARADLSEDNRDALERVRLAGRKMSERVDGMMLLHRLFRTPLEPEWIDLSAAALQVANRLACSMPDRRLRFAVAPDMRAFGDPALVARLLEELLSNAAKFSLYREEAQIELVPAEDGWLVRDNGVGFDMSLSSSLYEAFERLHRSPDFPGSGLGLAVAHGIVRLHGGQIEAFSVPGGGATFKFSLPDPKTP